MKNQLKRKKIVCTMGDIHEDIEVAAMANDKVTRHKNVS